MFPVKPGNDRAVTPLTNITAWLVFATAQPADAAQTTHAIPFASLPHCERRIDAELHRLTAASRRIDAERRVITIKPFCTTLAPAFWTELPR